MTNAALITVTVFACATPAAAPPPVAPPSTPSGSDDAPAALPPPPPPTPRTVLDIAPATLTWGGDQGAILTLDAAGYASISRDATAFLAVPFARLTAAGDLQRTDGTALATIDDAGTVLVEGHNYGVLIKRDGTAWQRAEKLAFQIADDGTVSGTDPKTGDAAPDPVSRYAGPSATRRAIMLAKITWALWLSSDDPEAVPPGKPKPTSIAACDAYRTMTTKALACATSDKEWTKRLQRAITRVDRYATELPAWGRDATASACEVGATRLKAYFATRKCAL